MAAAGLHGADSGFYGRRRRAVAHFGGVSAIARRPPKICVAVDPDTELTDDVLLILIIDPEKALSSGLSELLKAAESGLRWRPIAA